HCSKQNYVREINCKRNACNAFCHSRDLWVKMMKKPVYWRCCLMIFIRKPFIQPSSLHHQRININDIRLRVVQNLALGMSQIEKAVMLINPATADGVHDKYNSMNAFTL